MRLITLILVIFLARCAHLELIDSPKVANIKDGINGIGSDMKNKIKDIANEIKDGAEKILPCVFGPQSVSILVFTSRNPKGKEIETYEFSNDDLTKPIVCFVHGFTSDAYTINSYNLVQKLIMNGYTVFSLDWSEGACTTGLSIIKFAGYPSAVDNTRAIGDSMASYVLQLINEKKVPVDNIMFIGHSLGAHVCGFASKKIQKEFGYLIPRLIAADPAAPLFLNNPCDQRVCDTDAKHVTVLHTSNLGLPMPIGHTDLFMHYAMMQPGCGLNIVCSHSRAVEYLADMLEDHCGFPGATVSQLDFIIKKKPPYPTSETTDCILATKKLFTNSDILGTYYVFVKSESPHCTDKSFQCQQ